MDVDLLEDSRTEVDEPMRSVRLHDDNVARLCLLDQVPDYKARLAILHNHDLVVFMTMQGCTMPGLSSSFWPSSATWPAADPTAWSMPPVTV
jgi:hypothetical protein